MHDTLNPVQWLAKRIASLPLQEGEPSLAKAKSNRKGLRSSPLQFDCCIAPKTLESLGSDARAKRAWLCSGLLLVCVRSLAAPTSQSDASQGICQSEPGEFPWSVSAHVENGILHCSQCLPAPVSHSWHKRRNPTIRACLYLGAEPSPTGMGRWQ